MQQEPARFECLDAPRPRPVSAATCHGQCPCSSCAAQCLLAWPFSEEMTWERSNIANKLKLHQNNITNYKHSLPINVYMNKSKINLELQKRIQFIMESR